MSTGNSQAAAGENAETFRPVQAGPKEITVGIAGAAGDGLDKTGDTLAKSASRRGLHTYAYNSYQSLIRGGHTWLRLRISEKHVYTHGDHLNILIALNQDSIERHACEVESGGVVIFNGDRLRCDASLLADGVRALPIPFKQLTKDMGRLLPVMQNTIALGALMYLMDLDFGVIEGVLSETFKHKGEEVIRQNVGVARAGYEYAKAQGESLGLNWNFGSQPFAFMTGNSCIAMGAVAGGCQFYAAYPMSPASSILDWMTAHSAKCGVVVKQVEDEIGVANMTIGAGHAGVRAMCGTSGGGFALMTEAIGMASMIEAPAVFVNVQRGGPSTGLPTKTEQADLNQAIGASQGDFQRVILAPKTAADCYYTAAEALNLAEEFQIPVMILSDLLLGEHTETLEPEALRHDVPIIRGPLLREAPVQGAYKRYALTESGVSPRVLPGTPGATYVSGTDEHDEEGYLISDEHTNPGVRRVMADKRERKMAGVRKRLIPPEIEGPANADVTLVGWGSTWGALHEAAEQLNASGLSTNHLHIRCLMPFQSEEVSALLGQAKCIVIVENNQSGQMAHLLRGETGIAAHHHINKYNGEPFTPGEVAAAVRAHVRGEEPDGMVSRDEARSIAYHYISIHMEDRARPTGYTQEAANGFGEPTWRVELTAREGGSPMGALHIGRSTGSTYAYEPA